MNINQHEKERSMIKKLFLFLLFFYQPICACTENYSVIASLRNEPDQVTLYAIIECIEKCIANKFDMHIIYDSSHDTTVSMLPSYLHTRPVTLYYHNGHPSIDFYSKIINLCKYPVQHAFSYDKNSLDDFMRWATALPAAHSELSCVYPPASSTYTLSFSATKNPDKAVIFLAGNNRQSNPNNTSILNELALIKQCEINNPIIILDNAHLFYTPLCPIKNSIFQTLPTLKEYIQAILQINPDYQFACVHDTLISFTNAHYTVSPLCHACSVSRLYDEIDGSIADILTAEAIIAQAEGSEKKALDDLAEHYTEAWGQRIGLSRHYPLWKGLMLLHEKNYSAALDQFQEAYKRGLTHWRIAWYMRLVKLHMEQ
jgi:hypothetical protein